MQEKLHWTDVEELACATLDIDPDTDPGSDAIERALLDKFDVSFEQFQGLVEALLPLTPIVRTALTGTPCRGFVKDDCFIVKQEVVKDA